MVRANDGQPQQRRGWTVEAFRRPNGRYPLGESICRLREPARTRAINAVFELLTLGVIGMKEGSPSFRFLDAKQLSGDLYEASRKGDLRIIATAVPKGSTLVLLDVIQKKRKDIPPDVMDHLRRLQDEALKSRTR